MRYETVNKLTLPKIGFGTWSIGGGDFANPLMDGKSLVALRSAMDTGYTHFDTAEIYANGHAEELLGHAVRDSGISREKLFITSKVQQLHLKYDKVLNSLEGSLRRLQMDYLDLYLIHWPTPQMNFEETFQALNKLVSDGRVRHLGVSNFDVDQLRSAQKYSATPIITNQVPYRLPDDKYVENGVIRYCQENDILVTAYSPVKFRSIRVKRTIKEVAAAHSATPFQVALAWLVMQPRVITIPMSFNPQHIQENFAAADILLSGDEMTKLTAAW
jgi:diketogulonate reductase-like aldo/keto reductase